MTADLPASIGRTCQEPGPRNNFVFPRGPFWEIIRYRQESWGQQFAIPEPIFPGKQLFTESPF